LCAIRWEILICCIFNEYLRGLLEIFPIRSQGSIGFAMLVDAIEHVSERVSGKVQWYPMEY